MQKFENDYYLRQQLVHFTLLVCSLILYWVEQAQTKRTTKMIILTTWPNKITEIIFHYHDNSSNKQINKFSKYLPFELAVGLNSVVDGDGTGRKPELRPDHPKRQVYIYFSFI